MAKLNSPNKTFFDKTITLLVLIVLWLLSCYRLFRPGFFSMQDDIHVFRLQQFDKCFIDKQIPCRYIPDGGFGYGYPLFNFYSPLPYVIGEGFHFFGLGFIDSIKAVFITGFLLTTIGMYLFGRYYWGNLGGLISTVIYLFAPYRSVDSYVRGALAEFLALSLIPFIFWSITKSLKTNNPKNHLFSIIFLTFLFLSHNLTTIAIIPFLIIYALVISRQQIIKLLFLILVSFSLSSFFLIPAFFEKNLVTIGTMTQGYFNYVNHFVSLYQLFISRFWGYGASLWGPKDDMSFQVGYFQWIVPLILFFFVIFKNKYLKFTNIVVIFLLFSLLSLFLTHSRSTFLWQAIPFMAYFQFPWRFIGIAVFFLSFISGNVINLFFKSKLIYLITFSLIILIVSFNIGYFKEDIWFSKITDSEKLDHQNIIQQSGAGLKDYWPIYGKIFPNDFAPSKPIFSPEDILINSYQKNSNNLATNFKVLPENASITFPLVYFPGWTLYLDNRQYPINYNNLGLITLQVNQGNHQLLLEFKNTPIRTFSNILSIITLLTLISYAIWIFKKR